MNFADLRDRLLALGALDVEWIKKVSLGTAHGDFFAFIDGFLSGEENLILYLPMPLDT